VEAAQQTLDRLPDVLLVLEVDQPLHRLPQVRLRLLAVHRDDLAAVPAAQEQVRRVLALEEVAERMVWLEHVVRQLDAVEPPGQQQGLLVVQPAAEQGLLGAGAEAALTDDEQRLARWGA